MWLPYTLAGQKRASVPSLNAFSRKILPDSAVFHEGTVVEVDNVLKHRVDKDGVNVACTAVAFFLI